MPLKPANRLPKKFNRPVKRETRRLVQRRHGKKKRRILQHVKISHKRTIRFFASMKQSLIWWLAVTAVVLLCVLIGVIAFSPLFHIRAIHVSRVDSRLDVEAVQKTLAPLFGKHLVFFSNLEAQRLLRESLPDVDDVRIDKQYPSELLVSITLQPLIAQLHIVQPEADPTNLVTQTGSVIDFVTAQGLYVQTPFVEGGETLPVLRLVDWGVRPVPDTKLLVPEMLQRINATETVLADQFGQYTEARIVFLRAQEFHMLLNTGITLWFDLRDPLEKQIDRYRIFLSNVNLEEIEQYVDIRLSDRVIYK